MFDFTLKNTDGKARHGEYTTPHGSFSTPNFMACGTKGVVKGGLEHHDLKKMGGEIILANTYHLTLRPGSDHVAQFGGLQKWTRWNKPMLTDSGGFQVFSLSDHRKISEEGVEFRSHLNGDKIFLGPENAMQIQEKLGADIIMAFDECAPGDSSHKYAREAMERTHRWVLRCKKEHEKLQQKRAEEGKPPQALFPIAQGVIFDDLRIESTKFMADLDLPGIAIGGLSVGESKEDMHRTLDVIHPHLPEQKLRYLMGVGSPEDLVEGVARGIDLFDCVLPTRLARHGTFLTAKGKHNLKNKKFAQSSEEIEGYTLAYLRHIFFENELTARRILTINNLRFTWNLMKTMQQHIAAGTFEAFRKEFHEKYKT